MEALKGKKLTKTRNRITNINKKSGITPTSFGFEKTHFIKKNALKVFLS
jgi:hypothetical protein